ncbi:galactocerebrosidase-like [Patella vulgata]|uniref:galactocerebrosidase-like n=1 Tax=Patella vulgata TaxID=6465 RepID=UPI0024A8DAE0|nr:galactocerebrosidase-like [Patella vulgata]
MGVISKTIVIFTCFTSLYGQAVYPVDITNGLGRRFDGIGGLSAGASSKLLVNYPQKQRDEILDYLFKPNVGASLQILKVEIGGDAQSTDGTEATHMRNRNDTNYLRGYEWWLMKEAKKRNPNIKLYGLPWGFPGWVGNYTQNPYTDAGQLAEYVISWILGAREVNGLDIDYIGIWNERMYDIKYVKTLRKQLDMNNFTSVKIIAADYFGWNIAFDIMKDPEFDDAIYGIGVHYPGTSTSVGALQTGKPLWSSEDFSSLDDLVGGGCWARLLNRNYVNGFMTSTISWALIASWYEGLPYNGDGLMTANEPWSGHYDIETPIWVSAHTTQFTTTEWSYLQHGSGVGNLQYGGTFVSLVSPDQSQLTIVIETMSHDTSVCIRPKLPAYNVSSQSVEFNLKGKLGNIRQFYVRYSKLSRDQTFQMFTRKDPISVINGIVRLNLGVDEVWTLTTVSSGNKEVTTPPPSKPFPVPYHDDFEEAPVYSEPNNLSPQIGSFEIVQTGSPPNQVVRQTSLQPSVEWCAADSLPRSLAIIGSYQWVNVNISIRFNLDLPGSANGIFLAARINETGCDSHKAFGVFLVIYPTLNRYLLNSDIASLHTVQYGNLTSVPIYKEWNTAGLSVNGYKATAVFNNKMLFSISLPTSPEPGFYT